MRRPRILGISAGLAVPLFFISANLFAWGTNTPPASGGNKSSSFIPQGNDSQMRPAGDYMLSSSWGSLEKDKISYKNAPHYNGFASGAAFRISDGEHTVLKEVFRNKGNDYILLFACKGEETKILRYEDIDANQVKQFEYFDSPRNMETGGKLIEDVASVKHDGPYKDSKNCAYYLNTYFNAEGKELAGPVKVGLDGKDYQEGTGAKIPSFSPTCKILGGQRQGADEDVWGYSTRDQYAVNPLGEPFEISPQSGNAFNTEKFEAYEKEVISNAESVTLLDGSRCNIAAFSYTGGVITDKGYYIKSSMIEEVNGVNGNSYHWVPRGGEIDDDLVVNSLFENM